MKNFVIFSYSRRKGQVETKYIYNLLNKKPFQYIKKIKAIEYIAETMEMGLRKTKGGKRSRENGEDEEQGDR